LRKTLYISIFLGLLTNLSFSQSVFNKSKLDSLNHKRIYQIEIGNNQVIELTETNQSETIGTLTNKVWKTNHKGIRKKQILNTIKIPDLMARRLLDYFQQDGITELKDCKKVGDCINGADGTTITFRTYQSGILNQASFWQLHSDSYYNKKESELYHQIVKARKVYSHIKSEFDLQKQFRDFINRLPKGTYSYGMIILTKK